MLDPKELVAGTVLRVKLGQEKSLYDLGKFEQDYKETWKWPAATSWQSDDSHKPKNPVELPPRTFKGAYADGRGHQIELLQAGSEVTVKKVLFHAAKTKDSDGKIYGAHQALEVGAKAGPAVVRKFVYSTYQGIDGFEIVSKPEDSKKNTGSEKNTPKKKPKPSITMPATPPKQKPGDANIEVHAGQTVVVELNSTAKNKDEEKNTGEKDVEQAKSSIEVELVDEHGKPYKKADVVHLIGEKEIFTVPINRNTGKGTNKKIKPGEYDVALKFETIYFESGKHEVRTKESEKLKRFCKGFLKSKDFDFKQLKCAGYADKDGSAEFNNGLSVLRARAVKRLLVEYRCKIKKDYIRPWSGGELSGESDEEKMKNRKVEIYGVLS